jgi:hypothetical protein
VPSAAGDPRFQIQANGHRCLVAALADELAVL